MSERDCESLKPMLAGCGACDVVVANCICVPAGVAVHPMEGTGCDRITLWQELALDLSVGGWCTLLDAEIHDCLLAPRAFFTHDCIPV